jgi:hypothetical protein
MAASVTDHDGDARLPSILSAAAAAKVGGLRRRLHRRGQEQDDDAQDPAGHQHGTGSFHPTTGRRGPDRVRPPRYYRAPWILSRTR